MKSEEPESDTHDLARPATEVGQCVNVQEADVKNETTAKQPQSLYCILSEKEKVFTICICSLGTFLGPVAGGMYLPAIGSLARDLHVSTANILLTLTTFRV
ncbi:uncharacterized protein N7482_005138 [Penicillium canariense]|uniref:Major facilitator superfamily (MFS) profile domain-containing protein n=1 Tax=Penicillium canariense TaxID=189055 RepID=A0A9W9I618_9EURO|nr:uncharacterized protein N7482_005138 [Penicillium canariense]KAJ5166357.1 hypothetical protein N7482_005138 [Penicillium canariense]